MYAPERQREIVSLARAVGRVDVRGLAQCLEVTQETVRRDLTTLEQAGLLRRVHGGAIPAERLDLEPPVAEREGRMMAEKERIATAALDELPDGGSVVLDAGTTTVRLAQLLPTDRELTVVTHALPVASLLAPRPNVTVHLLGGVVRTRTLAAVGDWARESLGSLFVDVAFLGTNGLSADHGLTTPDLAEATVKRALVERSRRTVVLADHMKIGRRDFAHVCPLASVDAVITDTGLSDALATEVEAAGPTVVRA
ncbi:DeoR/GlpR family DNA-binding transcription regulator [Cellulomonas marina]|uniref:Lactose phosphotransferase system repressor n=1 Tax=Cellulomonas marina TaxID=988821 RepID=A0A1I0ZS57_9CELL|nr:DeoR/GlpR family DNA-binding transcription regulator [Cellulomonas marina]GIG28831.1 DeoR family transcriptional regulator [Cellulomonas marina]SFB27946.1 DeoR family transcriptional regulator, fructose operon transcriptional repressor [Cellulomonas marina]